VSYVAAADSSIVLSGVWPTPKLVSSSERATDENKKLIRATELAEVCILPRKHGHLEIPGWCLKYACGSRIQAEAK